MIERRTFFGYYALALATSLILLYLALTGRHPSPVRATSTILVLEATQPARWQDLLTAGSVLQNRLRRLCPENGGALGWVWQGDRLVVSVPPELSQRRVVVEASRVGLVEIVEGGTEFLPVGSTVETGPWPSPDRGVYQVVLTAEHFVTAEARMGERDRPVIEFILTPAGDHLLAAHTVGQRGYYLCLVVDGQVLNCPVVRTPLVKRHGLIELTGNATLDDACTVAMLLRSGPLPVLLKPAGD